jgi:ADP-heptose:LPS heptosyltransferase
VPLEFRQKFYPTFDEQAWAVVERAKFDGPVVVVNPNGSTVAKHWPHVQKLIDLCNEAGMHAVVLGDLRGIEYHAGSHGRIVGLDWDIRRALTFAAMADVVVGTESAIVNAVAFEQPLKIVLLSHSSDANLTQHWLNTVPVSPATVACHPCHRIHRAMTNCSVDKATGAAACQAIVTADTVFDVVRVYLEQPAEAVAA